MQWKKKIFHIQTLQIELFERKELKNIEWLGQERKVAPGYSEDGPTQWIWFTLWWHVLAPFQYWIIGESRWMERILNSIGVLYALLNWTFIFNSECLTYSHSMRTFAKYNRLLQYPSGTGFWENSKVCLNYLRFHFPFSIFNSFCSTSIFTLESKEKAKTKRNETKTREKNHDEKNKCMLVCWTK